MKRPKQRVKATKNNRMGAITTPTANCGGEEGKVQPRWVHIHPMHDARDGNHMGEGDTGVAEQSCTIGASQQRGTPSRPRLAAACPRPFRSPQESGRPQHPTSAPVPVDLQQPHWHGPHRIPHPTRPTCFRQGHNQTKRHSPQVGSRLSLPPPTLMYCLRQGGRSRRMNGFSPNRRAVDSGKRRGAGSAAAASGANGGTEHAAAVPSASA